MKPTLYILWGFIGLVCAYDIALSVRFANDLSHGGELNPIGRWLIALDGGNISILLATKWLTNLIMFLVLILSSAKWPRKCLVFSVAVAVAQGILLGIFWM